MGHLLFVLGLLWSRAAEAAELYVPASLDPPAWARAWVEVLGLLDDDEMRTTRIEWSQAANVWTLTLTQGTANARVALEPATSHEGRVEQLFIAVALLGPAPDIKLLDEHLAPPLPPASPPPSPASMPPRRATVRDLPTSPPSAPPVTVADEPATEVPSTADFTPPSSEATPHVTPGLAGHPAERTPGKGGRMTLLALGFLDNGAARGGILQISGRVWRSRLGLRLAASQDGLVDAASNERPDIDSDELVPELVEEAEAPRSESRVDISANLEVQCAPFVWLGTSIGLSRRRWPAEDQTALRGRTPVFGLRLGFETKHGRARLRPEVGWNHDLSLLWLRFAYNERRVLPGRVYLALGVIVGAK